MLKFESLLGPMFWSGGHDHGFYNLESTLSGDACMVNKSIYSYEHVRTNCSMVVLDKNILKHFSMYFCVELWSWRPMFWFGEFAFSSWFYTIWGCLHRKSCELFMTMSLQCVYMYMYISYCSKCRWIVKYDINLKLISRQSPATL